LKVTFSPVASVKPPVLTQLELTEKVPL
jgi:hypothetical protein